MKLPLLVSVPHAGRRVPEEAAPFCILSGKDLLEDGDVGAPEIYRLESEVTSYLTTDVARAIVDLNRAENDRRKDGVVKTHTCWDVPVYSSFPPEHVIAELLKRYHRPYHARLRVLARSGVELGVDCHTMASHGPPVGPDPGVERPRVCLSNADGTCSDVWITSLKECFVTYFGEDVHINRPFEGGFIIRAHSSELPWVQLELNRTPFMSHDEKRQAVLAAFSDWCRRWCIR